MSGSVVGCSCHDAQGGAAHVAASSHALARARRHGSAASAGGGMSRARDAHPCIVLWSLCRGGEGVVALVAPVKVRPPRGPGRGGRRLGRDGPLWRPARRGHATRQERARRARLLRRAALSPQQPLGALLLRSRARAGPKVVELTYDDQVDAAEVGRDGDLEGELLRQDRADPVGRRFCELSSVGPKQGG